MQSGIRLGDLMIDSGIVSEDSFHEALQMAKMTGMPVGRMLVLTGVSEAMLQATVQVQSLLKDGLVARDVACKALRMVAREDISLDDALVQLNWSQKETVGGGNKLGELLVESGFVTPQQLETALQQSFATGLPFGRLLVLSGDLSEPHLSAALNAQILIRDSKVTKEQACEALRSARAKQTSVEMSLAAKGYLQLPSKHNLRLGELLEMAGVLAQSELMNAVEIGLVNQSPIGQILVELGYMSEQLLHCALSLQTLVGERTLQPLQAAEVLKEVHRKGYSLQEAIFAVQQDSNEKRPRIPLTGFLQMVGMINDDDIRRALDLALENSQVMGRMLLITGAIDESTLQTAMRCNFLINEALLAPDDAGKAFNLCQRTGRTLDESLEELGIVIGGRA